MVCLLAYCLSAGPAAAQTLDEYVRQRSREVEQYKQKRHQSFEEYRARRNREFAAYIGQRWQSFQAEKAKPLMPKPSPTPPTPHKAGGKKPAPAVYQPKRVTPKQEEKKPEVLPFFPKPEKENPKVALPKPEEEIRPQGIAFRFYGTPVRIMLTQSRIFKLGTTDAHGVAQMWKQMAGDEAYERALADCAKTYRELDLDDWGCMMMVEQLTARLYPSPRQAEAVVAQGYLLSNLGIDVRIVLENEKHLRLAVASKEVIYGRSYLTINNRRFYLPYRSKASDSYKTYPNEFSDRCRPMSLQSVRHPKLRMSRAEVKPHTASKYPQLSLAPSVNQNLIDYYRDYPQVEYDHYARVGMSRELEQQIIPQLQGILRGVGEEEAVERLLNFVQTGFAYAYDNEQFHREKPLIADESFYYPGCDCEDRAILFTSLVRRLLHLKVALIRYHDHMMAAVCFTRSSREGASAEANGNRYIICEATGRDYPVGVLPEEYRIPPEKVYILN